MKYWHPFLLCKLGAHESLVRRIDLSHEYLELGLRSEQRLSRFEESGEVERGKVGEELGGLVGEGTWGKESEESLDKEVLMRELRDERQ